VRTDEELISGREHDPGVLWIVATPIGTIGDISSRAREVLAEVDLILAEDTRRARSLLSHLGVQVRALESLHEHNERDMVPRVLARLEDGLSAAVVSEAGTPVLSDPGFVLVREARRRGLRVLSVPGPSVFAAALAASGQPPLPAVMVGFLPPRRGPRRRRLAELNALDWSLVILLSPHRLRAELEDLAEVLGAERQATLLAEISKLHERAEVGSLGSLAASDEARRPRGEYVVVVGPCGDKVRSAEAVDDAAVRAAYAAAVAEGSTPREALRAAAERLGLRRGDVYKIVHVNEKTSR
jgi:16S rRNA (cytidine1402-2'-O)-methyltransferase